MNHELTYRNGHNKYIKPTKNCKITSGKLLYYCQILCFLYSLTKLYNLELIYNHFASLTFIYYHWATPPATTPLKAASHNGSPEWFSDTSKDFLNRS